MNVDDQNQSVFDKMEVDNTLQNTITDSESPIAFAESTCVTMNTEEIPAETLFMFKKTEYTEYGDEMLRRAAEREQAGFTLYDNSESLCVRKYD